MPFRSTSRIFAALFGAFVCAAVLAAPAAFAAGIDTPSGVTTLPFSIQGADVMTMTTTGLGIGTTVPTRTLDMSTSGQMSFGNNVTATGTATGIYWHSTSPNGSPDTAQAYGIFRTPGGWSGNYQQLEMEFPTGIIIDGGSANGKSGTVLQPNGGNVGIGVTIPQQILDIKATGTPEAYFGNVCSNSTSYFGLAIGNNGKSDCKHYNLLSDGTNLYLNAAGGSVLLGSNNSQTVTINSSGEVGIGMTPAAKLDVNGGMRGNSSGTVAGQACSPEGMLAYDMTNHQAVYCNQSGVWTAVMPSGFMSRTWHCVSDGHAVNGAVYGPSTNAYGYPMEISGYNGNCTSSITVYINGTPMLQCANDEGYQDYCSYDITVPVGASFQVNASAACGGYYCALY